MFSKLNTLTDCTTFLTIHSLNTYDAYPGTKLENTL